MVELKQHVCRKGLKLMGNQFEFSVVADDERWAQECIEEAIT
jgi:FAD:protein FMN transferase